jgi:hypothetical protein
MQTVSMTGKLARFIQVGAIGLLVLSSGGAAMAQPSQAGATVEGVWLVQVTLRNCDTGAPMGPPFTSLLTFAHGGTVVETPGSLAFAPGQRSNGHGYWAHDGGRRYSQQMVALLLFTTPPGPGTPGFEAGWQMITQAVDLVDADHIESEGQNWFYRSNGELYRSGCSTATGSRFK